MASRQKSSSSTVVTMEARQEQLDAKYEGEQQERQITWQELAKHNKPHDAWVGLYGSVYDVSKWGRSHPGTSSSRFLRTKYCGIIAMICKISPCCCVCLTESNWKCNKDGCMIIVDYPP